MKTMRNTIHVTILLIITNKTKSKKKTQFHKRKKSMFTRTPCCLEGL